MNPVHAFVFPLMDWQRTRRQISREEFGDQVELGATPPGTRNRRLQRERKQHECRAHRKFARGVDVVQR